VESKKLPLLVTPNIHIIVYFLGEDGFTTLVH